MRFGPVLLAASAVLAATPAVASQACREALKTQASASGLPPSLAEALASSLALGPDGKMYPYAVHVDGRVSIESSASSAARLAMKHLSGGAAEVRVGCMGISLDKDSSMNTVLQALDPRTNVKRSIGGISSGMDPDDIGAPLAAIREGRPLEPEPSRTPPPPAAEPDRTPPPPAEVPLPEPLVNPSVGQTRQSSARGSIGSTWGLFNDRSASPLTNP